MANGTNEIELIDVINILAKWKWLIVIATCAGIGCGWLLSDTRGADKFEATVMLLLRQRLSFNSNLHMNAPTLEAKEFEIRVSAAPEKFYESLALADDLKQTLIDSLGLDEQISWLDGLLRVEHIGETGMKLKVQVTQPQLAIDMVNAWAELFLRRNQILSADEIGSFYDYVSTQTRRSRQLLEAAEDSLQFFETSNQIPDLQRRVSILEATIYSVKDTMMHYHLKDEELQAELQSAEREVVSLEINGAPMSIANAGALKDTSAWPEIPHARSVLALILKLDGYQGELRNLDREYESWLAEFDEKHNYDQLELQIEASRYDKLADQKNRVRVLQQIFHSLRDDSDIELKLRVLKEIRQETARDVPSRGKIRSVASVEDRPELSDKYSLDKGDLLDLFRQRDRYLEQYLLKRQELTRQAEGLRKTYDVHMSNRVAAQVKIARIRPQLQSIQIQILRINKFLDDMQNQLQEAEERLSFLLSRRNSLTLNRETYTGSFHRFSAILEETRLAREKVTGDIQLLTRAIEARLVPQEAPISKALIGGAVGLIVSMFVGFLLTYVNKMRQVEST